jgi:hypothetical protein
MISTLSPRPAEPDSDVGSESFLYYGVNGGRNKTLIEHQNVLYHQAESFRALIPIEVVPSQVMKTRLECSLHREKGVALNEAREHGDTVFFQLLYDVHQNTIFIKRPAPQELMINDWC